MTVGVVEYGDSPGEVRDAVAAALRNLDARSVTGDPATVLEASPDWTVTVGDAALAAYVREGGRGPVLALECEPGVPSIPVGAHERAIASINDDGVETADRRLLSIAVDGSDVGTALFDVMLVTSEPARISEYAIETADARVESVRADGIVLATPAGSSGYAADAGGPIVEPGTDVVSIVPVAPFVTNAAHWILDLDDVTLTVEREEPVDLVVDGANMKPLEKDTAVHVSAGGTCTFFAPPGHRRWHDRH